MVSQIHSAVILGIDGVPVEIETFIANGLPHYQLVGLPGPIIKESKERVRSALQNIDFEYPMKRIVQNISPANLKKEGEQLDLALAMGIVCCSNDALIASLNQTAVIGEVALDGRIRPVKGVLSLIDGIRKKGIHSVIIPEDNLKEAAVFETLTFHPYGHLKTLIDDLYKGDLKTFKGDNQQAITLNRLSNTSTIKPLDFADVMGQDSILRAIEVAVAGEHNILMIGPPGCGKTMIAERIPSIMKPLRLDEKITLSKIYSIAQGQNLEGLIDSRPVRMPHHSITRPSLLGGGIKGVPGEISLAHQGVLVLDELAEFRKEVLEGLREPMSHGEIRMVKYQRALVFPSQFMLVATMNPCPCGYYMSKHQNCICTDTERKRYRQKLSGPILDRIDIIMMLDKASLEKVNLQDSKNEQEANPSEYTSAKMKKRIDQMLDRDRVKLSPEISNKLVSYYQKGKISMRGLEKIKSLSMTIAALEGKEAVDENHMYEAMSMHGAYRKDLL